MNLTKEELYRMEQADIREAVWDNLPDISQIEIDKKKPVPQRAQEYVQKVGNPFLVRVGAYTVKLGYSDCEETLNDRMKQYIRKIAEIKYECVFEKCFFERVQTEAIAGGKSGQNERTYLFCSRLSPSV